MENNSNLIELLDYIDPAIVDYQDWVNVGMALKEEGYTAADWDEWSSRDVARYRSGECFKKWDTFRGTSQPVTAGTIVQMAKDQGWSPHKGGHELEWDDIIGARDELVLIDKNWVEGQEVTQPDDWQPVNDLVKYLEILFEASENVGYVTDTWQNEEGKYLPKKGSWDRTAGELIQQLNQCNGDIGAVLGDCKPEAGAWIRFNPLDGKGCKNENVTEFRYALVESDVMEIDQQNAIIRELELPVACLVHSGNKSLHAIVKVEAANYEEYRKRVDYLYTVCQKNGLKIDSQNRNPSRLSRMPGIMRGDQKQFMVDTNIGKENWKEWHDWIEAINDDLPEPENIASVWDNLPALSPPLIEGVLRQGHKMLLAGPSKAGKSFALIEMCIGIAEGQQWFGWDCTKGKIMYVNLELDRASCLHRFKDVYQALNIKPDNLDNIDIWNLRGKSVPMDKLAPKLIRRAAKKNYIAIIIDPIYKVITGDENSADQMANFCNQFDRVCTELGAAVIYCHHHSKGSQGGKRSMDRASGSGVFARDPDALLDLIELELNDDILKQEENKAVCQVCKDYLFKHVDDWDDDVSQDDLLSEKAMIDISKELLSKAQFKELEQLITIARKTVQNRSAWRIDGTLREFPKFPAVNLWFDYPVHTVDTVGTLNDIKEDNEKPAWQKAMGKRKSKDEKAKDRKESFEIAYECCSFDGDVTIEKLAEYLAVTERTVKNRIKEHGGYYTEGDVVGKKKT